MREPKDEVVRFWSLASERTALGTSILVRRPTAPELRLANFLYAVAPGTVGDLNLDLDRASEFGGQLRIMIEVDTPSWVEAELLLRGWSLDTEFRLVLHPGRQLTRPAPQAEVRPAGDVDADWSGRAAMFRIDHLEEDARHRNQRATTS